MQIYALIVSILVASASVAASGQEPLQRVRDLYAAAAYEDALAVLTSIPREARAPHVEQYRVFCLLALGQTAQADAAIETVLLADPLYVPDSAEASPRMIQAFTTVRERILPSLVKRLYADAKAALDRKEGQKAVDSFENVLRVIDGAGARDSTLADLRVLADGFLELSRALPAPPPAATPANAASASTTPADAAAPPKVEEMTRPVAIKQEIPAWIIPDAASRRREFTGLIRVRIGTDGRVHDTELIKRLHPAYDALLVRAANEWVYQPATKGGVAVPADVVVEVRLRPQD